MQNATIFLSQWFFPLLPTMTVGTAAAKVKRNKYPQPKTSCLELGADLRPPWTRKSILIDAINLLAAFFYLICRYLISNLRRADPVDQKVIVWFLWRFLFSIVEAWARKPLLGEHLVIYECFLLVCTFRLLICAKALSHIAHTWFFSSMWTSLMCLLR